MTAARRVAQATAAVLIIVVVVLGGAWALVRFGHLSIFWTISWSEAVTRPDDGALLLGLITLIGWIAWASVVLSFVSEALAAATGQQRRLKFPGSELLAPVTAVLIAAVAGLLTGAAAGALPEHTGTAHLEPVPVPQALLVDAVRPPDPGDAASQGEDRGMRMHLVQPGDDLWSLAEQYYGEGAKWRMIAAANHTSLLISTDHLEPGMMLAIPEPDTEPTGPTIVVQPGQTLSELSAEYLGDPARWPDLVSANLGVITDPDLIDAGWRLRLPPAPTQVAPTGDTSNAASAPEPQTRDDHGQPGAPPSGLEPCPVLGAGNGQDADAEHPAQPGTKADSDQPSLQAGFIALGAAATTALASVFFLRRRQQLAKRPLGHAVPRLPADGRRAGIMLAHAAHTAPASAPPVGAIIDHPAAERGETEIVLGVLGSPAADWPDGELCCDVESEQVSWLHGQDEHTVGMATAMALALTASPATQVIVAGASFGWLADLDEPRLDVRSSVEDACRWFDDLAARRTANRDPDASLVRLRADPLLCEAWSPVVLVVDAAPARLPRRFSGLGLSMIICAGDVRPADGSSAITVKADQAVYLPTGEIFVPHRVNGSARRALREIFEVAAATEYPVADWWATYETAGLPIVLPTAIRPVPVEGGTVSPLATAEHPVVKLLGTIELIGARGAPPPRAIKQCVEYCAWLLENPGGTAVMMSDDLMVAEATRRSNMSRLRNWLGADDNDAAYLPDAYSGHIALHPGITSDWEHLQSLVGGGVNRIASASLVHALELVRGTPLADAAPGQWHWAEQLRHDMVSTITDIAVVLARRALKAGDLDSARWAIEKGLASGSEDEDLAAAQIQLAHLQDDDALVDRLVMQLTRRTRCLGIDLSDETVTLLQEVVEGRARLRRA